MDGFETGKFAFVLVGVNKADAQVTAIAIMYWLLKCNKLKVLKESIRASLFKSNERLVRDTNTRHATTINQSFSIVK